VWRVSEGPAVQVAKEGGGGGEAGDGGGCGGLGSAVVGRVSWER